MDYRNFISPVALYAHARPGSEAAPAIVGIRATPTSLAPKRLWPTRFIVRSPFAAVKTRRFP
jgi:hypothetical protein